MTINKSPIVTRFLVFVNIFIHTAILFYAIYIKNDPLLLQEIYYQFGLVPASFWSGSIWQPFTSMFLHGFQGLSLHLFINMIALWSLGSAIELSIGSIPFTWLYFISGLFGSLSVVIFQPDLTMPTIGASGAIMGLLAALAIFYPNSVLLVLFFPMKARTAAIIFGFGSLLLALLDKTSNISHWGHFGGFVGGFLYTKLALRLKVGKNILINPYEDILKKQEEEILKKIQEIEQLRKEKASLSFENFDELFPPKQEEKPREELSNDKPKKIFFDPDTGKFYIVD
jgi:membrane associated rhomboid family serine protease